MNYDKEIAAREQRYPAAGQAQQQPQYVGSDLKPPPMTRFSGFAGQLEARVAHLGTMVDRLGRIADRLNGSVPEEAASTGKALRGGGANVAAQIEQALEDFDVTARRAERIVERLEML